MIDGIGRSGAGRLELVRSSTQPGAEIGKLEDPAFRPNIGGPSSPVSEMAAQGAPVDTAKIAAIRTAIAEGRYPVDPDRIADAMLKVDLPLFDGR
jgi:negative regulator of flagellin synthesis FlgM